MQRVADPISTWRLWRLGGSALDRTRTPKAAPSRDGLATINDVARNEGWVNVGIDHHTAEFAVESIRRWWWRMGHYAYPNAMELLITADPAGSNGYRTRLWKIELQKLARDTGLLPTVWPTTHLARASGTSFQN